MSSGQNSPYDWFWRRSSLTEGPQDAERMKFKVLGIMLGPAIDRRSWTAFSSLPEAGQTERRSNTAGGGGGGGGGVGAMVTVPLAVDLTDAGRGNSRLEFVFSG